MCPAPESGRDDRVRDGEAAAAIATGIRLIHALQQGRRPTGARTIWQEDVIVCVLEGVLTAAEARAAKAGGFERVRGEWLARREATEPDCRALVEKETARPVRACMAELAPEGIAFEAFILG